MGRADYAENAVLLGGLKGTGVHTRSRTGVQIDVRTRSPDQITVSILKTTVASMATQGGTALVCPSLFQAIATLFRNDDGLIQMETRVFETLLDDLTPEAQKRFLTSRISPT